MADVRKFLDMSTGHLTPEDKAWLDETTWNTEGGLTYNHCDKTGYGWFMYAYDDRPDRMSDNLWSLCEKARDMECSYILFDADAEELEDHPFYDDQGKLVVPVEDQHSHFVGDRGEQVIS